MMTRRSSIRFALILGIVVTLTGCDGREHANPLDPMNPDTGGTPDNFNAVADDGSVSLEWRDLGFDDLAGYGLIRVEEESGESTAVNESPIPASETSWLDGTAINGHTYTYALQFLTAGNEIVNSLPDRATPGPSTVWVADFNSPAIRRISPDGRDLVLSIRGLSGPWDLTITPSGDHMWVADFYGGFVRKYDIEGELLLDFTMSPAGRGRPMSLGYDEISHTLWIGGFSPDGIVHISDQGIEISYDSSIPDPVDIEVSRLNGTVWVASRDSRSVYRHRAGDASFTAIPGFDRPASVSVDPGTGRCWVADGSSVIVLADNGTVEFTLSGFTSPEIVAVDAGDGSCWVADDRGSWSVSRVNSSGGIETEIGGFDFISDMAVDESDGSCWVATVTIVDGEITKLSREGELIGRVGRLAYPAAIDVLP